jgi:hypothetical protein
MTPGDSAFRDPAPGPLGRLVREHGPDRQRLITFVVVSGLIAAFFLGLIVRQLLQPFAWHVKVISVLLFGSLGGACVGGVVYFARRFRWRVRLHECGLEFVRGSRVDVVPWDDVQSLYSEVRTATMSGVPFDPVEPDLRLRLVTTAGKRYPLDNTFRDLVPLSAAVTEGVLASLRSRADRALRRGEGVPFGPMAIFPDGIAIAGGRRRWWDIISAPLGQALSKTTLVGGRLAWDEVKTIRIEAASQGPQSYFQIVIKKKGKKAPWAVQRVPDIPNFELFVQLVERLHQPIRSPGGEPGAAPDRGRKAGPGR